MSILYTLLNTKKNFKINDIKRNINYKKNKTGQVIKVSKIKLRIYLLINFFMKLKLRFTKDNIVSIGSTEVKSLIKKYPKYLKNIVNLWPTKDFNEINNLQIENHKFIKKLKKNIKIKNRFTVNNFDTTKLFLLQIENISLSFDNIYKKFIYYLNLINKKNTKLIIFLFSTPVSKFDHNIFFKKICSIRKIPKVVWTHGGYCGKYLEGYDTSDFKDSENHFSYGSFHKEIVLQKNFTPKIVYKKNYNSYNIGSPYINENYKPKNNIKKKQIIFIKGNNEKYNQLFYPEPRGSKNKGFIPLHIAILQILKQFQDDYEIIFKDYKFSNEKSFWKNYLIENKMNKIKYITNEVSLNNILDNNQLIILPWASTTFFQSLPFRNQIFIYQKTMYTKAFSKCGSEIKYFTKKNIFLTTLKSFILKMNNIKFDYNTKTIKHFLNDNNSENCKRNFDLAVEDIIKRSKDV